MFLLHMLTELSSESKCSCFICSQSLLSSPPSGAKPLLDTATIRVKNALLSHAHRACSWRAVAAAVAPRFPGGVGVPGGVPGGVGVTLSTQIPIKIEIKIQILAARKFSPEAEEEGIPRQYSLCSNPTQPKCWDYWTLPHVPA